MGRVVSVQRRRLRRGSEEVLGQLVRVQVSNRSITCFVRLDPFWDALILKKLPLEPVEAQIVHYPESLVVGHSEVCDKVHDLAFLGERHRV